MSTANGCHGATLFVVEASGFHGASLKALLVGRALKRMGRRVVIAVPPGHDGYIHALRMDDLEIVEMKYGRFRNKLDLKANMRAAIAFAPTVLSLRRLIRREGITSVHTFELHHVLGPIAGRLAGAQVVWHLGNLTSYGAFGRPLRWLVDRLSDQIVAVCRAVAEFQFPSRFGRDPRFMTLPVPVDLQEYRPGLDVGAVALELNRGPEEIWVGQVGGLYPIKGVEHLVKAAALVQARTSRVVRFLHAGPSMDLHEPYRLEILQLIRSLGLDERFRILGGRKTIADVMNFCDIVVNASLTEGLPTVVLEAMACARPVVATDVGGVPECVVDGVTGVLVPPGDEEALAAGILRLVEDRELAARMGCAGRKRAEELLGAESLRPQLRALL